MGSTFRLDMPGPLRDALLPHCRLKRGEIWQDPVQGHRVGCLDAASSDDAAALMDGHRAVVAAHDPPYNLVLGNENTSGLGRMPVADYVEWCAGWIRHTLRHMTPDAHLYMWMGADQRDGFQPLPEVMIRMREFEELVARSFITLRNQRGYGTQKNWMAVRQELLYYVRGNPAFNVAAEYTDVPKKVGGYLKIVGGRHTKNLERGKSATVRAGNVWTDVQQVFYLMHENVPGCYAQKPLKAVERVLISAVQGLCPQTSAESPVSRCGAVVMDFFAHSGTTLLAAERLGLDCMTMDVDPVFAEIAIRRLEHYRKTGRTGWQRDSPFPEVGKRLG